VPALLPQPDPDGLLEYSVVYTDRSLNHMSQRFQGVMKDIARILKTVYNGKTAIVVPGSGTFGMEAVARQFATDRKCLIIRNGWFSFRWTQILDMGADSVGEHRPQGASRRRRAAVAVHPAADRGGRRAHSRREARPRLRAARRNRFRNDSAQRLPACRR
jgi:aspartate aminotransferase-like enzyme